MTQETFQQVALFEHRFWLQILGDHARFIQNSLAPSERAEIQQSTTFIQVFDQLLDEARYPLSLNELTALTQAAFHQAQQLRDFKLNILRSLLTGSIQINLPPTFINHMVNELYEYLRVLSFLINQQVPPPCHPVHHHLLWLLDGYGHAEAIGSTLDSVEKRLIEQSRIFATHFEDFYRKAVELAGYLRTNLCQFPALSRFHLQAGAEMVYFMDFLSELKQSVLNNQVLGTLSPLLTDHMAREECYYLLQLAQTTEVMRPDCDPTRPRVQ